MHDFVIRTEKLAWICVTVFSQSSFSLEQFCCKFRSTHNSSYPGKPTSRKNSYVFVFCTVKPQFTDTCLIKTTSLLRTVLFVLGKKPYFFLNLSHLIRKPVIADNGHFFLPQSTYFYRKPISLMGTLYYKQRAVINLSFLKVKKKVDCMSIIPTLPHTRYYDL